MSKQFVINSSNTKILDLLEHDELSVLIKAICGYINNDEFDIIDPKIEAIYKVLKIQMEESDNNVKSSVEKSVKPPKEKVNIPSFTDVFLYICTIPEYKGKAESLKFSLKAKYDIWVDNKWRDGFDKPIKNWKIKVRQILPHLKQVNNGITTIKNKQRDNQEKRANYIAEVFGGQIESDNSKNTMQGHNHTEDTGYTDVSFF